MSERTAGRWRALPSTAKAPRTWPRGRDPFADVWQSEVVPQLVADTDGRLQVLTLFTALCWRHPGGFPPGDYASVQAEVRPPVPTVPVVHIPRPDLLRYDALLAGGVRG